MMENDIRQLLHEIQESFSRLDMAAWYRHFHHPHIIVTPNGGTYAETFQVCEEFMGASFTKLKQRGFAKSTLDDSTIKRLSDNSAAASVIWSRWDHQGELMQRFGASYIFTCVAGRWGISLLATHSDSTSLIPFVT